MLVPNWRRVDKEHPPAALTLRFPHFFDRNDLNCAARSCLKKRKWQHTAIFAIAIVLLKGESIADAAARATGEAAKEADKVKAR